ncbi:hypothetical protein U1Q18_032232 [Sarracenia purpurea var. burkii]
MIDKVLLELYGGEKKALPTRLHAFGDAISAKNIRIDVRGRGSGATWASDLSCRTVILPSVDAMIKAPLSFIKENASLIKPVIQGYKDLSYSAPEQNSH